MAIRYNKIWGIILIALGGINAIFVVMLLAAGRFSITAITAAIVLLVGFGFLTQTYLTVTQNQIILHALLGPLKRVYPYKSDDDVKIERNALFVRKNDRWDKVPLSRFLVNNEDWAALEARFRRD
jgi:hypothetical protein